RPVLEPVTVINIVFPRKRCKGVRRKNFTKSLPVNIFASSSFPQQFLPTHIQPERKFQGILGADGNTRLAEATFGGKDAFLAENIGRNTNIHRTHFDACSAIIALTGSLPDLDQRETG